MDNTPDVLFGGLASDLKAAGYGHLSDLFGKGIYPANLSVSERAALSISNSLMKKFKSKKSADADAKALEKFLSCNDRCRDWNLDLNTSRDEELWGSFKNEVYNFFNPGGFEIELDPYSAFKDGGVGPGSSICARGQDFYTKFFDSPLTATDQSLYDVYSMMVKLHPTFALAEQARSERYGVCTIVRGNRLSFVAKTTEISRTTCTESTLNMWFQLACGAILTRRLKSYFGIDTSTQPDLNRDLARSGSQGWNFATIDLESASDSISTEMLRSVLPPRIFSALGRYRSEEVRLPSGEHIPLSLWSSMGNGFTFPLQTMLFACVVSAAYRCSGLALERNRGPYPGNFGVFGDDIICREGQPFRYVIRLLDILGFRVNSTKSFSEGPFRESCGGDFYHGHHVRGVYLKSLSRPSIYAAINNLVDFTAKTGIPLRFLSAELRRLVKWLPVPYWENADAGVKTPVSFFKPRVSKLGSYAYKAYRPKSSKLTIGDGYIATPKGERRRAFNSNGVMMAALAGRLYRGTILVRHDEPMYAEKLCYAPNWEFSWSDARQTRRSLEWERFYRKRWESAFYLNL